jgi:hypothetical protein
MSVVLLNGYKIITLFVEYVHVCCVVKLVQDNYIIRGVRPCLCVVKLVQDNYIIRGVRPFLLCC